MKAFKALLALAFTMLGFSAHADVPAGVTTAITTAVTDIGTIGAAILLVVIAVAGYNWLRKPIH